MAVARQPTCARLTRIGGVSGVISRRKRSQAARQHRIMRSDKLRPTPRAGKEGMQISRGQAALREITVTCPAQFVLETPCFETKIGSAMPSRFDGNIEAKRVLVTGGAGFLGSHLCERLVAEGNDVLCVDNYFTGRRSNIAHLLGEPGFEAMRHDITFPLYVEVDEIYNLACPASPIHYQHDPVQTTKTSVIGAINMLGLAKRCKAKILQASTSEIYGDPEIHPQIESYWGNVNPIGPRSCYDEGKRCAETLAFDYRRQHNVGVKVIRIFNTYGPRMHLNDGRVISNFVVQALQGAPITVYGGGLQTRSFCFVDDLIDGMIRMMSTRHDIIGPVNLGNPNEMTILDLAKLIIRETESESKIVDQPAVEDDPKQRRPDISRAIEALDWQPRIPLSEGLSRTIAYFRDILGQKPQASHP